MPIKLNLQKQAEGQVWCWALRSFVSMSEYLPAQWRVVRSPGGSGLALVTEGAIQMGTETGLY